jgi:hypothetical protein
MMIELIAKIFLIFFEAVYLWVMETNKKQLPTWLVLVLVGTVASILGYFIGHQSSTKTNQSEISNTDTAQVESWDQFRMQFFDDVQFQAQRVQFPLIDIGYSDDNVRDTIFTKKENFNPIAIVGDNDGNANQYRVETYDNFEMKATDASEKVISVLSFIEGNKNFYFKRIHGQWFLVAKEENNNI